MPLARVARPLGCSAPGSTPRQRTPASIPTSRLYRCSTSNEGAIEAVRGDPPTALPATSDIDNTSVRWILEHPTSTACARRAASRVQRSGRHAAPAHAGVDPDLQALPMFHVKRRGGCAPFAAILLRRSQRRASSRSHRSGGSSSTRRCRLRASRRGRTASGGTPRQRTPASIPTSGLYRCST